MKKSFTLIETLVAITIFVMAVIFVFGGISRYLSAHQMINNQLIAAYLAQEAIELIRNIRDTNWLKNINWDTNIEERTSNCFDYKSTSFPGGNCNCSPLKIDSNGLYNCSLGNPTIFTREVKVQKPQDSILIQVKVKWEEKTGTREIEVEEKIYNWLNL